MNCTDFKFIRRLSPLFDRLEAEKGVVLFHEHSAVWPHCAVLCDGSTMNVALGYEWVRRPTAGDLKAVGFLKLVRHGKDVRRVELLSTHDVPEHEAFAVKSHLSFGDALAFFKAESGFTHLPDHDQLKEGGTLVALFLVDGFDTAFQLIFRPHEQRVFEPSQVFGDE